jgi:hypothetical protein
MTSRAVGPEEARFVIATAVPPFTRLDTRMPVSPPAPLG